MLELAPTAMQHKSKSGHFAHGPAAASTKCALSTNVRLEIIDGPAARAGFGWGPWVNAECGA